MEPVFRLDTINEMLKKMADHLDMKEPVITKDGMGNFVVVSGSRSLKVEPVVGLITFTDKGYDQTMLADTPGSMAGAMKTFREHVDSKK